MGHDAHLAVEAKRDPEYSLTSRSKVQAATMLKSSKNTVFYFSFVSTLK
jgi:hypothetical protein